LGVEGFEGCKNKTKEGIGYFLVLIGISGSFKSRFFFCTGHAICISQILSFFTNAKLILAIDVAT
jgi:hypothetical protein